MEDIKFFRRSTKMRDTLNRRSARPNNGNFLVCKARKISMRVATGIRIIPTARMKCMTLVVIDASYGGKLGSV